MKTRAKPVHVHTCMHSPTYTHTHTHTHTHIYTQRRKKNRIITINLIKSQHYIIKEKQCDCKVHVNPMVMVYIR